ncbi:MAG TPA: STAS domain-containing protein [Polyangiaceae bacterium]
MDQAEVESSVHEILMVLTQVAAGDLSLRVQTDDAPDSPVGALALGINGIIEAWRESELKARKTKRALEAKLGTIETQAAAIRELSTPIMDIWEDILLLPIVGVLDTRRSADVMGNLLSAIVQKQSKYVILDITGVEIVDTRTADYLIKVVRASRLLGARCVLTGLSPAVAQTLVEIGADLSEVTTLRSLREGLRHCLASIRNDLDED